MRLERGCPDEWPRLGELWAADSGFRCVEPGFTTMCTRWTRRQPSATSPEPQPDETVLSAPDLVQR